MQNKIDITNSDEITRDVSSLVGHINTLSDKDKEWFSKVYFREIIKSNHYVIESQDELTTYVKYACSLKILRDAEYVIAWLAELQECDPKMYSKIPRITFQQALKHSEKWHAELAKKAEKSDRYIEPDAENMPKVLDMGDGWEVFWLKTKQARKLEGDAMGHCVGSGAYDNLNDGQAIFSIRKNNVAHITLELYQLDIKQAVTKGNGDVPDRYQCLVDQAAKILCLNLFIGRDIDDTSPIEDGWHENSKGDKIYIKNGLVNSEDGNPAIIYADGDQFWFKDGKRHREDGPAVIRANGFQEWYQNDKRHRLDGPAIVCLNGGQFWYKDGKQHREDGPAAIYENGTQYWYYNGKIHRENGPAIISKDGIQRWFVDGKLHRLDGPAVIYPDGTLLWFVDCKQYTEAKFNELIKNRATNRGNIK